MSEGRGWLSVAVICAVAGACAPGPGEVGATDAVETVALRVGHRSEWRVLWIEGETDLPDGAYVNYRVSHEVAEAVPAEEWPTDNLIVEGRAAVQESQFWARINTLNWPQGQVRIVVQFPFPPQPPAVIARYGALGEKLTGENVTDLGGIKAVEVEHVLEHRR